MNIKTTLYLVVALAVLTSLYFVMRSRPQPVEAESAGALQSMKPKASVDLVDPPLGDIVKVKVLEINDGKVRLSRRALLDPPPEGERDDRDRGDRKGRGDRGRPPRGDRGGGGDRTNRGR